MIQLLSSPRMMLEPEISPSNLLRRLLMMRVKREEGFQPRAQLLFNRIRTTSACQGPKEGDSLTDLPVSSDQARK
jgi:hypothetical protein